MVELLKRKRGEKHSVRDTEKNVAYEGVVKRDLLRWTYTTVLTLREYALLQLPGPSRLRRKKISNLGRADDASNLERRISGFLDSTLICSHAAILRDDDATFEQWLSFSQKGDDSHVTLAGGIPDVSNTQSEIVDFVVWLLFKREKRPGAWPKNLLCDGFRKRSNEGDPAGTAIPDVYSLYPNHHITALKQDPWPHLLVLLGKSGQKIMLDLLTERSIFVAIDAGLGNFYQLSGHPISELNNGSKSLTSHQQRSLSDIVLVRSRMLYAKPALTARGRVQHGFKHIHALNRHSWKKNCQEAGIPGKKSAHTAKMLMYIFPRQFGLHNVFNSDVNPMETAQKFLDYTVREEEISKYLKNPNKISADGAPKVPKRLRGLAWTLTQKLQVLHSRCSYVELLNHYCPSRLEQGRETAALNGGEPKSRTRKSQSFLGDLSETGHPSYGSSETWDETIGGLSRHEAFQFSSVLELSTSPSQVSSFCQAVLSRIIPNDFWGQGEALVHNKATVLRQVDHFIKLRRFESVSLHEISQGLKVAEIPWLLPPNLASQKTSQSDMAKRLELFHEFLHYVFDSLLIPLLRTNFYVTETSSHRGQIFYFRHDIWRRIASPALSILKNDMFEEVKLNEATNTIDYRRLGFSRIRLLPKGNKLRPIMNLRRRQVNRATSRLGLSINSILSPIHTALQYEKDVNPGKLGSTLFAVSDIYARLKAFKQLITASHTSKLYFAKVDVQSAFDTIPQDSVLRLMQSVPSQSKYTIVKHVEVQPGERPMLGPGGVGGKATRRWKASVLAQGQNAAFTARLQNGLATKKRNTVFVDGVAQKTHDTDTLMYLMTDHIQRNLVKIGKKYYRQKRGIPQGSVLSPFLCNYFYADLEKKHLGFLSGPDCLLMRLIDDFLLITKDQQKAVRFVETMHGGIPEYGVQISPHKSLVNFTMSLGGESIPKTTSHEFPYCGTCIHDATLDITKDTQAAKSVAIANSLTVEYGRSPGQNFQKKTLNAFKIQSHLMFFDTSHNAPGTVLKSLNHAFHETARKMVAYVRCLAKMHRPRASLIIQTICKVAEVACSILSSKARRLKYPDYVCAIHRGKVMSVAYEAFLEVLVKHQTNYGAVIEWLRKQDKRLTVM